MTTHIYVIHGYTASSAANWFPWLKGQFANTPIHLDVLDLPHSHDPHLEAWLEHLRQTVQNIDENTVFIGHSLGCVTALRYILEKQIKIKGVLLVAGFISENPMQTQTAGLQTFVSPPLDIEALKSLIPARVVITAIDDDIVPTEATQKLAQALGATLIKLNTGQHFIDRDGYTDFPVLLRELQALIQR